MAPSECRLRSALEATVTQSCTSTPLGTKGHAELKEDVKKAFYKNMAEKNRSGLSSSRRRHLLQRKE